MDIYWKDPTHCEEDHLHEIAQGGRTTRISVGPGIGDGSRYLHQECRVAQISNAIVKQLSDEEQLKVYTIQLNPQFYFPVSLCNRLLRCDELVPCTSPLRSSHTSMLARSKISNNPAVHVNGL
jgi:hypothetical protein